MVGGRKDGLAAAIVIFAAYSRGVCDPSDERPAAGKEPRRSMSAIAAPAPAGAPSAGKRHAEKTGMSKGKKVLLGLGGVLARSA